MKIVFITPRYHTNMTGWVRALKNKGCEVHILSIIKGYTEDYSLVEPKVYQLSALSIFINKIFGDGGVNIPRGFPSPIELYHDLKKINADVIIIRDISRWFSIVTLILNLSIKSKVIIYHQDDYYKNNNLIRKLAIDSISVLFKCAWITPVLGNIHTNRNQPKYRYFVPFSVNFPNLNTDSLKDNTIIKIISIGKFIPRKNFIILIDTISNLIYDNINVELTIIGEVSNKEHESFYQHIVNHINNKRVSTNVNILTNIPHEKIMDILVKYDIFILPAKNEAASISLLESLSAGLFGICSDSNGTKCYISCLVNGYIFKDNSADDLKNGIMFYINNHSIIGDNKFRQNVAYNTFSEELFITSFNDLILKRFNLRIK